MSNNEMQHYGVKGMHWGRTMRRAADSSIGKAVVRGSESLQRGVHNVGARIKEQHSKEFRKEYRQMQKDTLRHPIISTREQSKLPFSKQMSLDLKSLKQVNKAVADQVATKNAKKASNKKTKKDIAQKVLYNLAVGLQVTDKILKTAEAAKTYGEIKQSSNKLRENGHGISSTLLNIANEGLYKSKVDDIWK